MTTTPKGFDLASVLDTFRALEKDGDSITVLGDEDAMRVLSAWQKTDQVWSQPKTKMPVLAHGNHHRVWHWVCSGWTIDVEAIERGTGLTTYVVRNKLALLTSARLIYPDGNVHKAGTMALKLFVARKLGVRLKQGEKPKVGVEDENKGNTN